MLKKDDLLLREKCANVLICLQNIASKNYRSAVNVPFYMDKAKKLNNQIYYKNSMSLLTFADTLGSIRILFIY